MLKTFSSVSENERKSFFFKNFLCSKCSKGGGEWNFDNHAEKKWGGRNIPAQCLKMIKKITNEKETLSLMIFRGTCRMPSFHLCRNVCRGKTETTQLKEPNWWGQKSYFAEKPLFSKTFLCKRRIHFWQFRPRMSDKKIIFFRSIKNKKFVPF